MPVVYNDDKDTAKTDVLMHKESYVSEQSSTFDENCINLTYPRSSNNVPGNDTPLTMCMG